MLFIEINSLYLIYSNNRYKTKDMNLNIKGIINLDFRGFKSGKELYEFSKNGDNFDTLANVWSTEDENTIINYETLYEKFDEIWVLNNYIIAKRTINSDEIIINPDFTRYLLENSFNYLEEYKKEEKKKKQKKESEIFIENLTIDSVLDKISKVGIEKITKEEKKFLDDNC
jgi:hypothetical protein